MNETVTQAEFSRLREVTRAAVSLWKSKGLLVLTEDGLVDVDATDAKLAERPTVNRGGVAKQPRERKRPSSGAATIDVSQVPLDELAKDLDWTHAEAARVKEVYLALLRKQEFEVGEGKLVEIEQVARQVEREYSVVRERLLAIPGKLASKLTGLDRPAIEMALSKEINGALNELHDPAPEGGGIDSAHPEA